MQKTQQDPIVKNELGTEPASWARLLFRGLQTTLTLPDFGALDPVWTSSKDSTPIAIIISHWEAKWEAGIQVPQGKLLEILWSD